MLVDTNVLVDVLENDPDWADWSVAQLRAQAQIHRLVVNPVIYAELSLTFSTVEALDDLLVAMQIPVQEIPKPALFLAGKARSAWGREPATSPKPPTLTNGSASAARNRTLRVFMRLSLFSAGFDGVNQAIG